MNPRSFTTAVAIGGAVVATLFGSILVGFSPLVTGVLVLAAFGGGTLLARGANLLRGEALVAAKSVPTLTLAEISARGRAQAATFTQLAGRITDVEIRRRVQHIGERLATVFSEIERRPDACDDVSAVQAFVLDFLPRAVTIIERYIELAGKLAAADSPQISAVVGTVNRIADTVKQMHDRLIARELAEFTSANLVLQTELELENPALRPARRQEEHS